MHRNDVKQGGSCRCEKGRMCTLQLTSCVSPSSHVSLLLPHLPQSLRCSNPQRGSPLILLPLLVPHMLILPHSFISAAIDITPSPSLGFGRRVGQQGWRVSCSPPHLSSRMAAMWFLSTLLTSLHIATCRPSHTIICICPFFSRETDPLDHSVGSFLGGDARPFQQMLNSLVMFSSREIHRDNSISFTCHCAFARWLPLAYGPCVLCLQSLQACDGFSYRDSTRQFQKHVGAIHPWTLIPSL